MAGCGSSARSPSGRASAPATAAASPTPAPSAGVRLSPAKRRYLAHFRVNCRRADQLAAASSQRVTQLTRRLSAGDRSAVGQLTRLLDGLAAQMSVGLGRLRALGPPPDPDADQARHYQAAAARTVAGVHDLSRSVGALDAAGIQAATAQVRAATAEARAAARVYGYPTCAGGGGVAAGGPVA